MTEELNTINVDIDHVKTGESYEKPVRISNKQNSARSFSHANVRKIGLKESEYTRNINICENSTGNTDEDEYETDI